jgi:hypothetical protein
MTKRHPEMFAIDAKSKFGSDDLDAWLSESQKMRESGVYADDPEKMKAVAVGEEYLNRPYCLWFSDQNAGTLGSASKVADAVIPTIGADYVKSMAPVAEMQLLKAGVRLAATLDRIADQALGARPSLGDSVQEAILVEVQSIFKDPKASLRAHKAH